MACKLFERLVFYSTFPIQRQAEKGKWDFNLKAIYVIALFEFEILPQYNLPKKVIARGRIYDDDTLKLLYDKLVFILIGMHEFTKLEDELETMWDKWLYLLRNRNKFECYPKKIQEKILMKFLEQSELAQLSDVERYRYEHSLKVYWIEHAIQKTREKRDLEIAKFEEEYSQLLQMYDQLKSDYENMKSEMNHLKEASQHEKQTFLSQIIKNGFKDGMSIASLSKLTGLSEEEVLAYL